MQSKWWENYLVRYALGFVFAAVFSFFLLNKVIDYGSMKNISIIKKTISGEDDKFFILILLPLAASFCYISAAPIIVLHTGRYRRGFLDRLSRNFWLAWIVFGLIFYLVRNELLALENSIFAFSLLGFFLLLATGLALYCDFSSTKPFNGWNDLCLKTIMIVMSLGVIGIIVIKILVLPQTSGSITHVKLQSSWLYLSFPAIWICIGQYSVLYRILKNEKEFFDFYIKLSSKRTQDGFNDARETYSHLREHSNAFFIVAVEVSVFSFLLFIINYFEAKSIPADGHIHIFHVMIFTLLVWIVPAIFMWSAANRLERKFCECDD